MRVTASDIVQAIAALPRNRWYPYVNPKTRGKIRIVQVQRPEGPIFISRFDPSKGQIPAQARQTSISTNMIWRIANAVSENQPLNFDRILGASYNTRSVLEALLAHTPQFYVCWPGRIEVISSSTEIKEGHKHLLWLPNEPHEEGKIVETDTKIVISEIPTTAVYQDVVMPEPTPGTPIDIEMARRHSQMQVALVMIGQHLNFRTWIANNDRGIQYKGRSLGEFDGVLATLRDVRLLASFQDAARAAMLIDCIWFKNDRLMPAVLEIEHSTGVVTGLSRMKNFQDALPDIRSRWVIVAPDEDRGKVLHEANKEQFRSLTAQFFPYSAVEELYALTQKRKLKGVTDEFLDCFMEPCIIAA